MAGKSNKVRFGFNNVHIAILEDTSEDGNPQYETPEPAPGAVSFSPTAESRDNDFYADNSIYYTTHTNNGKKGDLVMANLSDELLQKLFGWEINADGVLLEVSDAIPKRFALMGEVVGDISGRRFVLYCCSASAPTIQYETSGETATPKTVSMNITATAIKMPSGKMVIQADMPLTETNKSKYDNFFKEVYIPDGVTTG